MEKNFKYEVAFKAFLLCWYNSSSINNEWINSCPYSLTEARGPTYVQDVQGGDVRGGRAQPVGRLHPDLVRGEEGEVVADAAGVPPLSHAVALTLLFSPVPPGHKAAVTSGS